MGIRRLPFSDGVASRLEPASSQVVGLYRRKYYIRERVLGRYLPYSERKIKV
tara:strand:- start:138 stop:293 length:156 start_codon:yes stop_codon:yes gene_type:complete